MLGFSFCQSRWSAVNIMTRSSLQQCTCNRDTFEPTQWSSNYDRVLKISEYCLFRTLHNNYKIILVWTERSDKKCEQLEKHFKTTTCLRSLVYPKSLNGQIATRHLLLKFQWLYYLFWHSDITASFQIKPCTVSWTRAWLAAHDKMSEWYYYSYSSVCMHV